MSQTHRVLYREHAAPGSAVQVACADPALGRQSEQGPCSALPTPLSRGSALGVCRSLRALLTVACFGGKETS